jgi:hypothetical protein
MSDLKLQQELAHTQDALSKSKAMVTRQITHSHKHRHASQHLLKQGINSPSASHAFLKR